MTSIPAVCDLKLVDIWCPICNGKMSILPENNAVSCQECITILPVDKVERVREALSK